MRTRDRYGEKERPSTEEQNRRRDAQRCQARAPQWEPPWSAGSGMQCIYRAGHDGPHKIGFSGGFSRSWEGGVT